MRTQPKHLFVVSLLSAAMLVSNEAKAQTPDQEIRTDASMNQIDFGFRNTIFGANSDKAHFQRYQDLRNGPTISLFRFANDTDKYQVKFKADNVGYRDQRYTFSYNNFGKVKMSFDFNQIPLFYSDSTRTIYSSGEPGVLLLDDSIQRGVEGKTVSLLGVSGGASLFNLESQRSVAEFKLKYILTPNLVYDLSFRNNQVSGSQPWGTSFGFTLADEIPVPIDRRTTDLGAGVELSNSRAYARFGYDGSFFRNNIPVVIWDDPLRLTDSPTAGPAVSRESLWPNTTQNTVSMTGGLKLPARSHATGFMSVGQLSNNNELIPFTINTALPVIPLSREMSEVKAQVVAMNYTFTSRPTNWMFLNTRYRQYQLDNLTEPFEVLQSINYDTSVVNTKRESEPFSVKRHTLDTDATWSPVSYLGFRAGYTRESFDRTHRVIEETVENTGRTSIDLTGISWLSLRGVYEHSVRVASPLNREELFSSGQQPSLRQYDISDRNRDRYDMILVVTPVSQFSVSLSSGVGRENYPATDTRTVFGLRSNNNKTYSAGLDFVPTEKMSFGVNYGYERFNAFQVSRTANPLPAGGSLDDLTQQYNDPRRDWTDDNVDRTKTFTALAEFLKLCPKTEVRLGYDNTWSRSTYVYGLAPDAVIPAPVQLPPITNRLQQGVVDGRYLANKHFVVGLTYRYDRYDVDDFAFYTGSDLAQPATAATQNYLMLGYFKGPYKANMMIGRLTYLW